MCKFEIVFDAVDPSAAGNARYNDQPTREPVRTRIPASGFLHGWDHRIVDASGDSRPRDVLHHLKLTRPVAP